MLQYSSITIKANYLLVYPMETITYLYIGAAFIFGYLINDLVELFMNKGKLTEEEWLEEQKNRGNL